MIKNLEDKITEKIHFGKGDECWPWVGATVGCGYGVVAHKGKMLVAHREAYRLRYGKLASTKKVLRTCKNRLCCNPEHMILGSLAEAHQLQRVKRNDLRRGKWKLSDKQKNRIKERALRGERATWIRRDYPHLSYITVLRLVHDTVNV